MIDLAITKTILFKIFLILVVFTSSRVEAFTMFQHTDFHSSIKNPKITGGDVVNNGGGLSEQALLSSAINFPSFLQSCLQYSNCGSEEPLYNQLLKLKSCQIPKVTDFLFTNEKESSELLGKPYLRINNQGILINRSLLYSAKNEALSLSEAMAYLFRIYMDYCLVIDFNQSQSLTDLIRNFSNFDSELVSVGKDDLNLPKREWIRIKTFYSDLIIETKQSMLRLSCPSGILQQCQLNNLTNSNLSNTRFKSLSLISERKIGTSIFFEIEGIFINPRETREYFHFSAEYIDGQPQSLIWMNSKLNISKQMSDK